MTSDDGTSLPDRRKYGYKELEEKLDSHAKALEDRLSRSIRGALIAFSVIGVMCTGALIGFGFLLNEQGNQAAEIQQQRYESVYRNCDNQNERHDDTIIAFRKVQAQAVARYPERREEIRRSVKSNLQLVEALVPKQDCDKLASLAVREK